jgi:hypothetical protein
MYSVTVTATLSCWSRCLTAVVVSQGAWRGRQNAAAALDVVDNFFTAVLSGTLQHDLQSKDLDLPLHSDRAHKLLAENTAAINMSYTVY